MDLHSFIVNLTMKFHNKTNPPNAKGCRRWLGARTRGNPQYGVIRVKFPGTQSRTYSAHRAMYMMCSQNFVLNPAMQVSHLCHNSLCCSFEHLSAEPADVNNSRRHCQERQPPACTGHPGYRNCILPEVEHRQ